MSFKILENPERKIHKVYMDNDSCKVFKKCFWDKEIEKHKKCKSYENMVKF
jgi:hypothetical protein